LTDSLLAADIFSLQWPHWH